MTQIQFFQIFKFSLGETNPHANPGGYWVPVKNISSAESRAKIDSMKLSFSHRQKQFDNETASTSWNFFSFCK